MPLPLNVRWPAFGREVGAKVMFNVLLRDMNVDVPASDGRRIEVLAQDLPCFSGTQSAINITLRSPLTSAPQCCGHRWGSVAPSSKRQREDVPRADWSSGRWAEEGVQLLTTLRGQSQGSASIHGKMRFSCQSVQLVSPRLSSVPQCDTVCSTGAATPFLAICLG